MLADQLSEVTIHSSVPIGGFDAKTEQYAWAADFLAGYGLYLPRLCKTLKPPD
jgi:hypothetical protein